MNSCRICGNTRGNSFASVQEGMFGTGESFEYLQCASCRCLQLHNPPEDYAKYYRTEYYSLADDPSQQPFLSRLVQNLRADQALKRSRLGRILLERFPNYALDALSSIDIGRTASILDVGCGSGSLAYTLAEIGFTSVTGIDPFLELDRSYSNGLTIRKADVAGIRGMWDLVTLFDSFEHMPDPRKALQSIAQILSPTGRCIMTIPTVSSFAWEQYGVHWIQLDAPRHFFLHSRESLDFLVREAGLVIEKIVDNSTDFQFWGSEQAQKGIPLHSETSYATNPSRSMFRKEDIRAFKERAAQLNKEGRGDQMAVYLKQASK